MHVYDVCPRNDKRGVDLISDTLHLDNFGMASRTQSAMQSEAGKAFWKIKPPPIKTAKSKIVPLCCVNSALAGQRKAPNL
jgi:hypothetical protein